MVALRAVHGFWFPAALQTCHAHGHRWENIFISFDEKIYGLISLSGTRQRLSMEVGTEIGF